MKVSKVILVVLLAGLFGCSGMYYGAMEKIGIHKRDILRDRVQEARDAQKEAKQQFLTALEQFKSVVKFQGGDLEKEYDKLNATLQKTEAEAAEVRKRVRSVEDVAGALFAEWRSEIKQYSSESLRQSSQRKYDLTRNKYQELIQAMKKAEAKLEPALVPMRDQVLFLKHNLNARAIAGLRQEVAEVQGQVDRLIRDIESAIAEADAFIAALRES